MVFFVKSKKLAYYSVLTALMIIFSWITIPLPFGVPFTMQIFGIFVISFILEKDSWKVILFYIFLGIIGLPVFSGFSSGPAVIIGPTGGFIIGFFVSSLVYIFKKGNLIFKAVSQILIIYFFGILFFRFYKNISFYKAFLILFPPFIIPDIIKMIIAFYCVKKIKNTIKK